MNIENELLKLFGRYIVHKGGLSKQENEAFVNFIIYLNNIVNNSFEITSSKEINSSSIISSLKKHSCIIGNNGKCIYCGK